MAKPYRLVHGAGPAANRLTHHGPTLIDCPARWALDDLWLHRAEGLPREPGALGAGLPRRLSDNAVVIDGLRIVPKPIGLLERIALRHRLGDRELRHQVDEILDDAPPRRAGAPRPRTTRRRRARPRAR